MSSSKSSNVECVGKQDWTSEYNHIDCTRYYREVSPATIEKIWAVMIGAKCQIIANGIKTV